MKSNSRFSLTTVMIMLVLIFSAIITVPAYADDLVPPPIDPPADVTTPSNAVNTESVPADSAPVAATSMPTADSTVADILAQVPDGTQVIVTNAAGDVVPLATTEATQTMFNGDPIWCPTGVAPKDGLSGCSPAMSGFTVDTIHSTPGGLLGWLNSPANGTTISKAGTIWEIGRASCRERV